MAFKRTQESDLDIVSRLEKEFQHTWFTAQMAKLSRERATELEKSGVLESSRTAGCSTINYRLVRK